MHIFKAKLVMWEELLLVPGKSPLLVYLFFCRSNHAENDPFHISSPVHISECVSFSLSPLTEETFDRNQVFIHQTTREILYRSIDRLYPILFSFFLVSRTDNDS